MANDGGWASPGGEREDPPRYGQRVPQPPAQPAATRPDEPAAGASTQAPSSAAAAPAPPSAPPQPYGAPQSYGSQAATAVGYAPAATGYVPPPKPGLVPLHPLGFGRLLGTSFAVIRWNPVATVVPALALALAQTFLVYGLIGYLSVSTLSRINSAATQADQDAIAAGAVVQGLTGIVLTMAISIFGSALLQGAIVTVVARGAVGEKPRLGAVLKRALQSIWPLLGFALLFGVAVGIAITLLAVVVVLAALAGEFGIAVAVIVGLLGGLGLLALYFWLYVKLATVPSVIVQERLGVFAAIARSWRLIRGSFWRALGLILLISLIVGTVAQIVTIPFSLLGSLVGGLLLPNGGSDDAQAVVALLVVTLPAQIVAAIVSGVGTIASTAATVLVWLDLRMRHEGLDLELRAYVESGRTRPDPLEPVRT